jgi:hypothetical protein
MSIEKTFPKKWKMKSLLGIVAPIMVFMFSCTKEDNTVPPIETSNIMTINALASAASTPLNFYLDTQLVNLATIAYGNTPTYAVVKPIYQTVTVKNATTNTIVATAPLVLAATKKYSIYLHGTTAAPLLFITQDSLSEPASGKARIRLVNLGQSVGSNIDLALRNDYQVPAVGKVIVSNSAFGNVSPFIEVDTCSNYNIQVFATGTTTSKASSSKLTLLPGINYTILVRGIVGGTPALTIQAPINNNLF